MSAIYLDARHPLATKQGWSSFVDESQPEPPFLLPADVFAKLDGLERDLYNEARQDYHSSLLLVATPDIRRIIHTGQKLVVNNRRKQLGRRGLLISGASGTGKSTAITQLGKRFQLEFERRNPGIPDRIPVVYILVPPDAGPKALATEMASFLGIPVGRHDSPQALAHSVASVMRRAGTGLVLVDEIHRLDLLTRKGKDASDQLKYFFDTVSATFVYAGLDLEETNLFAGVRGRQIAGRFIPISTRPFGHSTTEAKSDWKKLVVSMEQSLRLHAHKPGFLLSQAAYLHARTGGMIGSLDQLVYEAANDAIADGTENITKAHLDAVILDIAAGNQYEPSSRRPR
ncbi:MULTISPECIES: TniB family NTP-binding protein [Nocardia]|uniref:TniB family NTP-binding protein n=1 Tax=Nocardia TaxID=1817 RepID=UPI0024537AF6|nr:MULTISPECIES: TniB family NTP-binding protein [Nocardia]